jgi:hypothetical protein
VNAEKQQYLGLLERRIELLGALAEALKASTADVVSLDIDSLESRIILQQQLCVEIHALGPQLDRVQRQCATYLQASGAGRKDAAGSGEDARISESIQRLRDVQASVKTLNSTHQALLRRSRRTVGALLNSYHTFAMTYADPGRAAVGEGL